MGESPIVEGHAAPREGLWAIMDDRAAMRESMATGVSPTRLLNPDEARFRT